MPSQSENFWDGLITFLERNWEGTTPRNDNWWRAQKAIEATDTFSNAFQQSRMSLRTFGAKFQKQVIKATGHFTREGDDALKQFEAKTGPAAIKVLGGHRADRAVDSKALPSLGTLRG